MKTIILFILIVFLGAGSRLQAGKPIPSYNDPISHAADFREKNHNNDPKSDPKEKRGMIIVAQGIGPAKLPVSIWVYSIDKMDISGPFTIIGYGELIVPVDDREWGVLFECDGKAVVSVWTDTVTETSTVK